MPGRMPEADDSLYGSLTRTAAEILATAKLVSEPTDDSFLLGERSLYLCDLSILLGNCGFLLSNHGLLFSDDSLFLRDVSESSLLLRNEDSVGGFCEPL